MSDTTKVTIGGKEYEAPPIRFAGLRILIKAGYLEKLSRVQDLPLEEQFDVSIALVAASLGQVYPEVTFDFIMNTAFYAEFAAFDGAVAAIIRSSRFQGAEASSPNVEGP
jgi:hypothetical protein